MARRRKKNKLRGTFVFLLLIVISAFSGFLLKDKLIAFFDKADAGPVVGIENSNDTGNNALDGQDIINSNINDNNIENELGNENKDNAGKNNKDIEGVRNDKQDKDNKENKDKIEAIEGKQLVEDPDDILVLVNKKRYLDKDYKPSDLVEPNVKFSFNEEHEKRLMRKEAAQALEELFGQAKEEGLHLFALSGYRSYSTQKRLFENRASKVGEEEANKLSARPGESEHQTGLAMDITSQSVGFDLKEKFGETEEGKWIKDNAHKFGFIIRYAKDKVDITGYSYEPWHLRYLGKDMAKEIYSRGIAFEEYFE